MICVRAAQSRDLRTLMEIARHTPTAALWTDPQYSALCSSEAGGERLCLVVSDEKQVHGFLVAKAVTRQGDEWEIENIAVSGPARRRGLGLRLLGESLNRMRDRGGKQVFLEVRESNQAARKLYEKCAFMEVGQRKNYYQNPTEDALIFRFAFPQAG
jgi:ribosomal-protein-alanine N-acetyltransferase